MSAEYWTVVRGLVESGQEQSRPKHEITDAIASRVAKAEANGEEWASDVIGRWIREGAAADYTQVFKDMNTVTFIRADGTRVRKTVAHSRPMRSGSDGAIVGRQMQAWWGMARAAVQQLRNELESQRDKLGDSVTMLDLLIAAMDRHPECTTAADAWIADGHELDEIDLAGVA